MFLAWRIVINHHDSVTFWHDGPLHIHYCHVRIQSKKSFWYHGLSFVSMFRFWFTTVMFVCFFVFFQFTTLLFFVWYSHIESARFVIVYHLCVPIPTWHKKKRSMSQLTNPITPTDFLITGIRLLFFHNVFIIVLYVNRTNWVSTDSQHILFALLIRTHWTYIYIYIRMYIS